MSKRSVQISLVIVGVIGMAIVFLLVASKDNNAPSQASSEASNASVSQQQATPASSDAPTTKVSGVYTDYSADAVANASGITLLFFHAPWCSQCRALESDIKQSGVPDNTTILKVDYDSSQELRQKYGVTIQTTVVKVDTQGNSLGKYVAYESPSLQSVLNNLR